MRIYIYIRMNMYVTSLHISYFTSLHLFREFADIVFGGGAFQLLHFVHGVFSHITHFCFRLQTAEEQITSYFILHMIDTGTLHRHYMYHQRKLTFSASLFAVLASVSRCSFEGLGTTTETVFPSTEGFRPRLESARIPATIACTL